MEPFLREVERFLESGKLGQIRSEALRLAARSCVKGLQLADDDPDCRIRCVHLGTRDAVVLSFVPRSKLRHLVERWEKQWDILRFHHLHSVADKVAVSDSENPSLQLYFYL
jgi:hypothetical protein